MHAGYPCATPNAFQKTMTVPTPPGLEGLVDLACRDGVDIRPTLLRVLTDLYIQKPIHTPDEEQHYVELAQRLFKTVDSDTKAAVAARLMRYGRVPEALSHHLAMHTILPETPSLSPDPPEIEAAPAPTAEAQASELTEIFFSAEASERRLILAHLDVVAKNAAPRVKNAEKIVRHLEACALRHDAGAFARELVGTFSLDRDLADRIVEDPSGEPLLLIAKILEMPPPVLQRVLLFLNPAVGQSVQRVYDLAALYENFSSRAAAHLLSIFKMATPPAHPPYQAVLYQSELWDDGLIGAREAATPHEHRHSEPRIDVAQPAAIRSR
jgi:hypothetical protein